MTRKKTKEEIIAAFKRVHIDRYDYSLVDYTNTQAKVKIICKSHGVFQQTVAKHLTGQGCPNCGGNSRYDTEKIIIKFQEIHGDRYDYSQVSYRSTLIKVRIRCKIHGEFEQSPSNHMRGQGCPDCSGVPRYDKEKIIAKFREVHGDRYDYSMVKYLNSTFKIKIGCAIHGIFEQTPSGHLNGQGCPYCGGNGRYNNEKILTRFKKIHGARYDYSLVNYVNIDIKVKIICKIHGEFEQSPSNHMRGQGCPDCSSRPRYDNEKIIAKFREAHGDRYDYSLVDYKLSNKKIKIICTTHGVFEQTPSSHLSGKNCPKCRSGSRPLKKIEEILSNFRKAHGDKYDYSLMSYSGIDNKVKIICPDHGIFEQSPYQHMNGSGCRICSGVPRYNQETIIKKFQEVHGDKYDYSEIIYNGNRAKIRITCMVHGPFYQSPKSHLKGAGCPACAGNIRNENQGIIQRFKEVHGSKYDYSEVQYEAFHTKVKIICKIHGPFEQSPANHLAGKGCINCSTSPRYSQEQIITRFKEKYGDKYDYHLVNFINARTKVKILCKAHGMFEQTSDKHLQGQGCPTCNRGWSKEKIIQFINSIDNHDLLHMDAIELQMIINQGKLPDALNELVFGDDANRDNTLRALKEKLQDELNAGVEEMEELAEEDLLDPEEMDVDQVEEADLLVDSKSETEGADKDIALISLSENFEDLHVLDNALVASCDEEAVEFLIQYKLRKLWNQVLNDVIHVEKLKEEQGGKNFSILKEYFFAEYNEVIAYQPPQGYRFPYKLNAMQQLTVYRMLKNKRYGNWSGTGAGKTISFIVASRAVNARLTVLVGLNSTIAQLGEAIEAVYPDSRIFTRYTKGQVFDRTHYNYLILNYDKFQQGYSEELFQDLTTNNRIEFIAIDEVHNVKQRTEQDESIRRGTLKRLIGRASEENNGLYVLGMSATPVINNLTEAKSLLEMITGKEYEDLNTTKSITNAIAVFKQMTLNGLRYLPKYQIVIKELDGTNTPALRIDGTHLLDKLLKVGNQNYLGAERLLLHDKLKAVQPYLKNGLVIYSYFTNKMIQPIVEHLTGLGYRVGTFTGDESMELRDENKEKFLHGKIDILVGSRPIGTGVDGLQKICNRMIILSLPWTDSEYTQLKGRIYRQGSQFGEVEIIIPQVVIPLADRDWSWDMQRMNLIRNKKTLADASVDGVIPSKMMPQPETLFARSLEALKEWRERVNEGKIVSINRKDLVFPLRPEIIEQISRTIGDFSEVNRTWSVSKSSTTHDRLKQHPEDWYYYHTLYAEKRKSWEEIPYVEIAKLIKRKDFVVADLGCGENLLRKEIPENKVLAFDHVAIDETVTACDVSHLPIENDIVDVAVFSLSLMGTNYTDYIKEAHRILKPMGFIFIAEPQAKWEGKQDELEQVVLQSGFGKPVSWRSGSFLYLKSEKT